ncbi:hypothetical protein HDU93_003938, partial [Gonapodya sp. JEL0774]
GQNTSTGQRGFFPLACTSSQPPTADEQQFVPQSPFGSAFPSLPKRTDSIQLSLKPQVIFQSKSRGNGDRDKPLVRERESYIPPGGRDQSPGIEAAIRKPSDPPRRTSYAPGAAELRAVARAGWINDPDVKPAPRGSDAPVVANGWRDVKGPPTSRLG